MKLVCQVLNRTTYKSYQEGLPAYWGIETIINDQVDIDDIVESGRTTRLLGY